MTSVQLGKLWVLLSLFLLYYGVNSYLVIQGGQEVFGAKLVMPTRVPAAVWAIPICTIVLIISSIVGRLYAMRTNSSHWHARIPIVGFDNIDTESKEGRIYQAAMLLLLSILPAASLVHFWRVVLHAHIVAVSTGKEIQSIWDWRYFGWNNPASICSAFELSKDNVCADKATIIPGLEPWLFAVLTAIAAFTMALHVLAVFRPFRDGVISS